MNKTTLAAAAALFGLGGCADEALEPFYLSPIPVSDARFEGEIGEAEDLDVRDDWAIGERNGDIVSVTTAGEYDDGAGQAMTIVSVMAWNQPVADALRPGTRLHWGHAESSEEEEPAVGEEPTPNTFDVDEDVQFGADVIGCAGPNPETWYDKVADEVTIEVRAGETPEQRVLAYEAVFVNDDDPELPLETRVAGSFTFTP